MIGSYRIGESYYNVQHTKAKAPYRGSTGLSGGFVEGGGESHLG